LSNTLQSDQPLSQCAVEMHYDEGVQHVHKAITVMSMDLVMNSQTGVGSILRLHTLLG